MKKLSELGVSPAPWRFTDDGIGECDIRCSGVSYGDEYEGEDIIASMIQKKDAPMFAAAPDMYEALRGLLEIICDDCKSPYKVDGKCVKCPRVAAAEAALAKASGESEVEK